MKNCNTSGHPTVLVSDTIYHTASRSLVWHNLHHQRLNRLVKQTTSPEKTINNNKHLLHHNNLITFFLTGTNNTGTAASATDTGDANKYHTPTPTDNASATANIAARNCIFLRYNMTHKFFNDGVKWTKRTHEPVSQSNKSLHSTNFPVINVSNYFVRADLSQNNNGSAGQPRLSGAYPRKLSVCSRK